APTPFSRRTSEMCSAEPGLARAQPRCRLNARRVKEGAHGGTMGSPVITRISSLAMATTLPRNADVADQLDLLADLSEIRGDDSFRVSAYRRAATRVRETSAPVAELALAGRAKELQGIGKTIEEKIVQIIEHGEIEALTRRKAVIPHEVVLFMRLPGLGPTSGKKNWQE